MNEFLLWIARGFGVGRIPIAPGTAGSLIGLVWAALLLLTENFWIILAGTLLGLALCVPLCNTAERVLQQKDPGSVVLDEIAAMPLCFLGWIAVRLWKTGVVPGPEYFLSGRIWPLTFGLFLAFRLFDIVKPWPVRQSQSLPGGWGVTMDDVLAAVYVNLMVLAAYAGRALFTG